MIAQTLLFTLKENSEDFEWYPTTDEMIKRIYKDCGGVSSILDIGAGDGRVLEQFDKLSENRLDKYAIEISNIHITNMPKDISIIGTDFKTQTLIDKRVDVIFCNPPYSEFEDWSCRIIKEAYSKYIYLILPKRWQDSKIIKESIKLRKATYKTIWTGDFMKADRQSRAKVDIVKITICTEYSDWEREKTNPFDIWFDEHFWDFNKINNDDWQVFQERREEEKQRMNEIVDGQNLIEHLCNLYNHELRNLLENYKTLSKLDPGLLNEIGVKYDEVRKALKMKIEGLKNKYWKELFDHFNKITERLTSSSRQAILEKLNAYCNVDFSVDNAYAIAIWVIKNANDYLDRQLIEVFKKLSEPECVKNYKSNLKTWEKEKWRYKENHTHYMLEYRIITSQWSAIQTDSYRSYDYPNGLSKNCHDFINDVFTIANNLGFSNGADSLRHAWESNKQERFYMFSGKVLAEIRAFKNGNLHLKLNQEFIKAFNIEASRLLGWIKSPREAVEEMDLDIDFVTSKFGTHFVFAPTETQKLLTA